MTNDKRLPVDEAGDLSLTSTPAQMSQDVDPMVHEIDGAEDVVVADGPAGEELVLDDEDELDEADYEVVDDEAEELLNADETIDDTPDKGDPEDVVIEDEEQLAEAEAAAAAAKSTRPKRKVTTAPVKKNVSTPKQRDAKAKDVVKRTGPAGFAKQAVGELRKVIWPNGDQLREYYLVVLVFVLFVIAFVSVIDFGMGKLLLWLLGNR